MDDLPKDYPRLYECNFYNDDKTYCLKPITNHRKPYCDEHRDIMYAKKQHKTNSLEPLSSMTVRSHPSREAAKKKAQQQIAERDKES